MGWREVLLGALGCWGVLALMEERIVGEGELMWGVVGWPKDVEADVVVV